MKMIKEMIDIKFKVKRVLLHENKKLDIYIPIKVPKQLTAIDLIGWDKSILGNSIAYEFMRKLFLVAADLKNEQILYIPTNYIRFNEYRDLWECGIFDMDIVLANYHATQLKPKEILRVIKSRNILSEYIMEINPQDTNIIYPENWLTNRKLSTKRFKNLLIISTNKNVFSMLAADSNRMTGMEDNEEYNFNHHIHEDSIGTSQDNGFNFLYYHRKENL